MKLKTFIIIDNEFIIIISLNVVDLGFLSINFDFFFIFILTIFEFFQK